MSVIAVLLAVGGAGVFGLLAYWRHRATKASARAADAEGRAESATGALRRDDAARTAGDIIKEKADDDRRARDATDARLEAEANAARSAADSERRRTEEAAARGPDALTERANAAIREGRLPRGRPQ